MTEKFVYPAHKLHAPYRELTRDHDMIVWKGSIWHKPRISPKFVFPDGAPKSPNIWEEAESWFLSNGGVNLCNPFNYMNIRPGGLRLRLGVHPTYSSVAQAYEPLAFGIGILRPVETRQRGGLDFFL